MTSAQVAKKLGAAAMSGIMKHRGADLEEPPFS